MGGPPESVGADQMRPTETGLTQSGLIVRDCGGVGSNGRVVTSTRALAFESPMPLEANN